MGPDASRNDPEPLVLLATATDAWEHDEDAEPLLAALEALGLDARPAIWDDPAVRWEQAGLVVVRSTWDYPMRRREFLDWAARVHAVSNLVNPPEILSWNTDKTYLEDLARAGLAVVHTRFVPAEPDADPTGALEALALSHDEFVVKPAVSAGSRDTGRFDRHQTPEALDLARRILGGGRTVMLQPYLTSVDTLGETGLVYFDGAFSHAFNKSALLEPGGETEHGMFALERIRPEVAEPEQLELAADVLGLVEDTFAQVPMYARIDLLHSDGAGPVLLELELSEPSWFLGTDPDAPGRAAEAIASRLG